MVRQGHLIASVVAFLIGCVVLLVVGCAATRSASPTQQGHAEATREQTRSANAASEQARCAETRLIDLGASSAAPVGHDQANFETNDVPGCPKGGPLLGTASADKLNGGDGDDEVRGLGAKDDLIGGLGSDVIYGGPGKDFLKGSTWYGRDRGASKDALYGGPGDDEVDDSAGDDVLYGGDGADSLYAGGGEDVLYGGDGNDLLVDEGAQRDNLVIVLARAAIDAEKNDHVDSSCEKKSPLGGEA